MPCSEAEAGWRKVEIAFRWGGGRAAGNAIRGPKKTVRGAFKTFGINALILGRPSGSLVGTVQVFSIVQVYSNLGKPPAVTPDDARTAERGPQIANNAK